MPNLYRPKLTEFFNILFRYLVLMTGKSEDTECSQSSTLLFRAPQLHLSDDRMTIKGEKGYSMVRGTHGVRKGDWYYEIELLSLPTSNDSTVRVGFAQACADVQCP